MPSNYPSRVVGGVYGGGTPAATVSAPAAAPSWAMQNAIPGLSGLTNSATGIINSALNGLPSPSESRLQNAYFGAGSGLDPTSDFLRNRGYDLYGAKANQRQQQGLANLLSLVGTYSGTVAPTPGQELQDKQATGQLALGNRSLEQSGSQFQQDFGFQQQQWQKQLELLNQYLGGGSGGGGTPASGYGNVFGTSGGIPNAMDYSQYTNYYQPFGTSGIQNRAPATAYTAGPFGSYTVAGPSGYAGNQVMQG